MHRIPQYIIEKCVYHLENLGVIIGATFGVVAIKAPDWFEELNKLLLNADGFYKFGIFLTTCLVLWSRRMYYKKRSKCSNEDQQEC